MDNSNVSEYIIQSNVLMGQGKYEGAISILEKAEHEQKLNISIYIAKGVAYANLEQYEKAQIEFEKALKINKKDGTVYFHLGNIALLTGNKPSGIEYYNNAMAYGYDNAQLYYSLGLMYEEEGNDDLAIRYYSKATIKEPIRADVRIRKIKIFIRNNHMKEALQEIDELILCNPDIFEGYHLKYMVLENMGKLDEATKVVEDAIQLFPKDIGFAIDKASLMITKKEYDKALDYLNKIDQTDEISNDEAHSIAMQQARIYALVQDMNNTVNSLLKARELSLKMDPPKLDLEALYLLMNCYVSLEDYNNVITYAKELKKVNGENYYSLAAYYYEPLAMKKINGENYYSLAAYYYEPLAMKKINKSEEAKNLFKEAASILRNISLNNPGNIDSYAFRIMCLREIGEFEKALELADYLIMIKDDMAEAHTLKATILEDMGRNEEAKVEKAKAVSIGGIVAALPTNNR